MYDILLAFNITKDFYDARIKSFFHYNEYYLNSKEEEIYFDEEGLIFIGYTRNEQEKIFLNSKEQIMLLIGDVYLTRSVKEKLNVNFNKIDLPYLISFTKNLGNNFYQYLKGNYLIIHFDKISRKLNVINNKFGISPIYYGISNNTLYLSTSLKAIQKSNPSFLNVDESSLIDIEIFNYPLHRKTLLKNVYQLLPAEILEFSRDGLKRVSYWDVRTLYNKEILNHNEALEIGTDLFYEAVKIRTEDVDNVVSSLTGGFDGRTILSVLDKPKDKVMLYSFGIEGSLNVSIPKKIAAENGYNYVPIVLDKSYEENFDRYAEEMVIQSDCLRTIEGANYPYAFSILSKYSNVVLTGIFGSELLRTFQNVGLMVTNDFVELIRNNNSDDQWIKIKNRLLHNSYLKRQIIEDYFDETKTYFNQNIWSEIKDLSFNERFYVFLIKEGLRKYFGGEVQSERIYATNRFPFLDDDFVEFIFRSPFAGIYSNVLNPTPTQRFKSQYFYAKIIEKYKPELLKYTTDHGFPVKYLLSKYPLLLISIPYILNYSFKKIKKYREFKPIEWSESYLRKNYNSNNINEKYFNQSLLNHLNNGHWQQNYHKFLKAVSLSIWLDK